MKANELMIGDWVRKLERGGHSIPVKIIAIYEYNADYETREGDVGCMSIHGYEPIPLTAEILEKNRFRLHAMPENRTEPEEEVIYELDSPENGWYVAIGFKDGCIDWCKVDRWGNEYLGSIKSVHKLQHALRLCGIEKTIEL